MYQLTTEHIGVLTPIEGTDGRDYDFFFPTEDRVAAVEALGTALKAFARQHPERIVDDVRIKFRESRWVRIVGRVKLVHCGMACRALVETIPAPMVVAA